MTSNEQTLLKFQTRVRQIILRFQELKKENEELYAMLDKSEKDIENLRTQLAQSTNDYNSLKMAKMIEITDGGLENTKARLSKLIREVNKCITILKDQK
jgi:predicted nuclease with TOPRIM domain